MELFIVTYEGGVLLPRNVIDGLQQLESNKYQVEFDPRRRELVSACEKIKVLHKIIINLHQNKCLKIRDKSSRRRRV